MKNIKLSILCAALGATLVLAGCADNKRVVDLHLKYITANSAPLNSFDSNAQAQVASAATAASGSLEELSAIDAARKPSPKVKAPWNARAIGMTQLASIDWNGPVQPILQKIADGTGYHLRILGAQPPIPALVTVNAVNQPIADILRNVMYQVSNKADVQVFPNTHVLELRYFNS